MKKAQLQIQEMAFMLVALFFFFAIAGLFIFSIIYSNIVGEADNALKYKNIGLINNLAKSPEFSCIGTELKSNCIDLDKILALSKNYQYFWDFTSLKIIRQSGFNKTENILVECNFDNYPNCDIIQVFNKNEKNEEVSESFIALCRKEKDNNVIYDKCEIGKLLGGFKI